MEGKDFKDLKVGDRVAVDMSGVVIAVCDDCGEAPALPDGDEYRCFCGKVGAMRLRDLSEDDIEWPEP